MDLASALLRELRDYRPADALELQHCRALLELLRGGESVFGRTHFAPGHITASCFIVDESARLLLHHHKRLRRWLQMGGHADPGEEPQAAALREGREESGLTDLELLGDGILDVDVHLIPAAKGEPGHRHFDVRYLARTRMPESITMSRDESNDLTWFALDRAAAAMNEEGSARVIQKIAMLLGVRS